jgi:Domain of unknown function (DUF4294)
MKTILSIVFFLALLPISRAQIGSPFKGDDMDTVYFMQLDSFYVTARPLQNYNYSRYESIVKKVYPYADSAIMYIQQLDALAFEKRKDEKQYKKELEDKLRKTFEDKLKNLSRSQGEVLIDIIERNTNRSMYDILKEYKSGSSAFWWNSLSKAYGYDLKDKYNPNNNPTLEKIIAEYELTYRKK